MTKPCDDFAVVRATKRHAAELGPNLRPADATECALLHDSPATDILLKSVDLSDEAWAVMLGKKCVGLFGHRAVGKVDGVVWMVGSPELTNNHRRFARAAREWWPRITNRYESVYNFVWERNEVHQRWLRHLGCHFYPAVRMGRGLFRMFKYVRDCDGTGCVVVRSGGGGRGHAVRGK